MTVIAAKSFAKPMPWWAVMVDSISSENEPLAMLQNPNDKLAAIAPTAMAILANSESIMFLHQGDNLSA